MYKLFFVTQFFFTFFTLSIPYLSLIYPLSIPYLPLIYPLSIPYLSLIYPLSIPPAGASLQLVSNSKFKIQNSKFKIQNSELFSTEPSAKESRRAGAAEYVKPVRLALYTNFTCRWNGRNDQRLYFFC